MRGIVVDENVVMEAIEGRKPNRDHAFAEAQFMFKLFDSSNQLFVNKAIIKKYGEIHQKIGMRSRFEGLNNRAYKILMQTLSNSDRINNVEGVALDWQGLKKCDKAFVGVALQSSSILVTSDMRLHKIVADHTRGSGIMCAVPKVALDLLDVQD